MNLFITSALDNPFYFFSWIFIVMFSICVHEYAHAATALKCGDDTAAMSGHLSLNPLKQMGSSSIVMLLLFGIAWGSVPVSPRRLQNSTNAAIVAVAGPLSNLALAIVFSLLTAVTERWFDARVVTFFCLLAAQANGVLFLFNILPFPMLDGWAIFSLFIPSLKSFSPQQTQSIGMFLLLAVWFTPVGGFIWHGGAWVASSMTTGWETILRLMA